MRAIDKNNVALLAQRRAELLSAAERGATDGTILLLAQEVRELAALVSEEKHARTKNESIPFFLVPQAD